MKNRMKKMNDNLFRRIMSLLLCLMLCFGSFGNLAYATETEANEPSPIETSAETETYEDETEESVVESDEMETEETETESDETETEETETESDETETEETETESDETETETSEAEPDMTETSQEAVTYADETGDGTLSVVYVGVQHGTDVESVQKGTDPAYPVSTLADAYAVVADGGKIYVVDYVVVGEWPTDNKNVTIEGWKGSINGVEYNDPMLRPASGSGDTAAKWVLHGDVIIQKLTIKQQKNADVCVLFPEGNRLQIGSGEIEADFVPDPNVPENLKDHIQKPRVADTFIRTYAATYNSGNTWFFICTGPSNQTAESTAQACGYDPVTTKVDIHLYGGNNQYRVVSKVSYLAGTVTDYSQSVITTPYLKSFELEIVGSSNYNSSLVGGGWYNATAPAFDPSVLESVKYTLGYTTITGTCNLFRTGRDRDTNFPRSYTTEAGKNAKYTIDISLDQFTYAGGESLALGEFCTTEELKFSALNSTFTGSQSTLAFGTFTGHFKNCTFDMYKVTSDQIGIQWSPSTEHNNAVGYDKLIYNFYDSVIQERLQCQDNVEVNLYGNNEIHRIEYFENTAKTSRLQMNVKTGSSILPVLAWGRGDVQIDSDAHLQVVKASEGLENVTNAGTLEVQTNFAVSGDYTGTEGSKVELYPDTGLAIAKNAKGQTQVSLVGLTDDKGDFQSSISSNSGEAATFHLTPVEGVNVIEKEGYWGYSRITSDYREEGYIYLRQGGDDTQDGSSYQKAVGTVGKAYELAMESRKKIVLCSSYTLAREGENQYPFGDSSNQLEIPVSPIIFTTTDGVNDFAELYGASIVLPYSSTYNVNKLQVVLHGSFEFQDILFRVDSDIVTGTKFAAIFANNYPTIMGKGVKMETEKNLALTILGGSNDSRLPNTDLLIEDGTYYAIYGGGSVATKIDATKRGSIHLTVKNCTFIETGKIFGGNYSVALGGTDVVVEVTPEEEQSVEGVFLISGGNWYSQFGLNGENGYSTAKVKVSGNVNMIKNIELLPVITGIGDAEYTTNLYAKEISVTVTDLSEASVKPFIIGIGVRSYTSKIPCDVTVTVDNTNVQQIIGGIGYNDKMSNRIEGSITMNIGLEGPVITEAVYGISGTYKNNTTALEGYPSSVKVNLGTVTTSVLNAGQSFGAVPEDIAKNIEVHNQAVSKVGQISQVGTFYNNGILNFEGTELNAMSLINADRLNLSSVNIALNGNYQASEKASIQMVPNGKLNIAGSVSGKTSVSCTKPGKAITISAPLEPAGENPERRFTGESLEYSTEENIAYWKCEPNKTSNLEVVYLDGLNGNDEWNGQADTMDDKGLEDGDLVIGPVKTLEQAYEMVMDGGTIVICGATDIAQWSTAGQSVKITSLHNGKDYRNSGAYLCYTGNDYMTLNGDVTLRYLNFYYTYDDDGYCGLDANGYKLIIGDALDTKEGCTGAEPDVVFKKFSSERLSEPEKFLVIGGGRIQKNPEKIHLEVYNTCVAGVIGLWGQGSLADGAKVQGNLHLILQDCKVWKGYYYCSNDAKVLASSDTVDGSAYATVMGNVNVEIRHYDPTGMVSDNPTIYSANRSILRGAFYADNQGDARVYMLNTTGKTQNIANNYHSALLAAGHTEIIYDGGDKTDNGFFLNTLYMLRNGHQYENPKVTLTLLGKLRFSGFRFLNDYIPGKNAELVVNIGDANNGSKSITFDNQQFLGGSIPEIYRKLKSIIINYYPGANVGFNMSYVQNNAQNYPLTTGDSSVWNKPVVALRSLEGEKSVFTFDKNEWVKDATLLVEDSIVEVMLEQQNNLNIIVRDNGQIIQKVPRMVLGSNLRIEGMNSVYSYTDSLHVKGDMILDGASFKTGNSLTVDGTFSGINAPQMTMIPGATLILDKASGLTTVNYGAKAGEGKFVIYSKLTGEEHGNLPHYFTGGTTQDGKTLANINSADKNNMVAGTEYLIHTEQAAEMGGYASWSYGLQNMETDHSLCIFLSDSGDDMNSGKSPGAPVKTLAKALELAAANAENGGEKYIILSGDVTLEGKLPEVTLPVGCSIVLTQFEPHDNLHFGGIVTVKNGFTIPCELFFRNVTLNVENAIYAGGHRLVMDKGVEVRGNNATIYGGLETESVASTHLDVYSGNWYRIYGGGKNGDVTGNTQVHLGVVYDVDKEYAPRIQSANDGDFAPAETRAVFGGGESGQVSGSTDVEVRTGDNYGYIYGGGYSGNVADDTKVTVQKGAAYRIFGGSHSGNVTGSANIILNEGTVNRIYGGGYTASSDVANTKVTIGDGTGLKQAQVLAYIRGSGNLGGVSGQAELLIQTGAYIPASCNLAAGGYQGNVAKAILRITGGEILCDAFAGGAGEFIVTDGTVTDEIDATKGNVTETELHISGGTIQGNIFGGGNLGTVGIGGTKGTITGGSVTANVYGGGNQAPTKGDITLELNTNKSIEGKLFGGGRGNEKVAADVTGTTNVTLTKGTVTDGIYGGCDANGTVAQSNVIANINSGCSIFGGGYGEQTLVESANLALNSAHTLEAPSAYGGGEMGKAGNTNVQITSWYGDAFGGGKGSSLDGFVDANTQKTSITINGKITGNIYGGGELATIGGTDVAEDYLTHVIVTDGAVVTGNIYGGGRGHEGQEYAGVCGNTLVEINGGKIQESGSEDAGSVFGGGQMAPVLGGTHVKVAGGDTYAVYGGNDVEGVISKDTQVDVTGGQTDMVYGGGRKADYLTGTANVNVNGGQITAAYGGGYEAKTRESNLVITAGSVDTAYGGGNAATVTEKAVVTVNSQVRQEAVSVLFAGNNQADMDIQPTVKLISGNVGTFYGGGNQGRMTNPEGISYGEGTFDSEDIYIGTVYGGCNEADVTGKGIFLTFTNGTYGTIYGGNNASGDVKQTDVVLNGDDVEAGTVYGGGNQAALTASKITALAGTIDTIYGGGNQATVTDHVEIHVGKEEDGTSVGTANITTLYCGNNAADMAIQPEAHLEKAAQLTTFYGGGNAGAMTNADGLSYTFDNPQLCRIETIFGGCNQADVVGPVELIMDGTPAAKVYGGCNERGNVPEVTIKITGDGVTNVYGGGLGRETKVEKTLVDISNGEVKGNVYGGSGYGYVKTSSVEIKEDNPEDLIKIQGSVYGGGYGVSSITENTDVVVDMKLNIAATDAADVDLLVKEGEIHTTGDVKSSGKTQTTISWRNPNVSYIKGNVFGGGDMGKIGDGKINAATNSAEITVEGHSSVLVKNGWIQGSLFGGGSGIPVEGTYSLYMGTNFGDCEATIQGGYIAGSIYGCGYQSRVFAGGDGIAANVDIEETTGTPIVIGISVFGGGNKGEGMSTNASVDTVLGNTTVNITGIRDDNPSAIYFLSSDKGGVYGDGNLCLVRGIRTVNITDFNMGNQYDKLKTFYSLQRADVVNLTRTRIVLEGAKDLVDENADDTLYAINRVAQLNMYKNSTIKLTTIVNLLGGLWSDEASNRKFIDRGYNGVNSYTTLGGSDETINALTEKQLADYIKHYENYTDVQNPYTGSVSFNTVCVANGLYLEIKKSDTEYGNVEGLFTLELLEAVPGEGGGFVYADIEGSTGDFIAVTKMEDQTTYMTVYDNVGGRTSNGYRWYFWYLKGGKYNYNTLLQGYIGTTETEFPTSIYLPELEADHDYILKAITGEAPVDEKNSATKFANSRLKDHWDVNYGTEDYYAIEVVLHQTKAGENGVEHVGTSLGFLAYNETSGWGLKKVSDEETTWMYGVGESREVTAIDANTLLSVEEGITALELEFILYKGSAVDVELKDIPLTMEVRISPKGSYDNKDADKEMTVHTYTSITRLVPTQSAYLGSGRLYSGVTTAADVHITPHSAMTAQFITRFVPSAFASGITETLKFSFDEIYLLDEEKGIGYTIQETANGAITLLYATEGSVSDYTISKSDEKYNVTVAGDEGYTHILKVERKSESNFTLPVGTKITLVAKMDDYTSTFWYYYCTSATDEIALTDFYQMNTPSEKNIKYSFEAASGGKISQNTSNRITENLTFVLDFSNVSDADNTWWQGRDTEVSGQVQLRHTTAIGTQSADIMDYVSVEKDDTGQVTGYTRRYPVSQNEYTIGKNHDGITEFTLKMDNQVHCAKGTYNLIVNVVEDLEYDNTFYEEREYAIMLSLKVGDNFVAFPEGTAFLCDGQRIAVGKGNMKVILPIRTAGNHSIQMVTELQGFEVNQEYTLCADLFSSSVSSYYNLEDTTESVVCKFSAVDNPTHTLAVDGTEQSHLLAGGQTLKLNIYTDGTMDSELDIRLFRYNKGTMDYSLCQWNGVFTQKQEVSGTLWQQKISDNAIKGTYRLEFTYADKTEYWDFIVE